jgi:hypothetical protein
MLRGRVGRCKTGKGSRQNTEKVQDQGEKYDVFDFAHDGWWVDVATLALCRVRAIHSRRLSVIFTSTRSSTIYLPMLTFQPPSLAHPRLRL